MIDRPDSTPTRSAWRSWLRNLSVGLNCLSVDAVIVSLVWQWIFCCGLRGSSPSWVEQTSLGGVVWLIYVADRLLDATRLNIERPRTVRHDFYFRHRSLFVAIWGLVLLLLAALATSELQNETQRNGLLVACGVLMYGAGVHLLPPNHLACVHRVLPKELQVGFLFALGVSLVCWGHTSTWLVSLAVAHAAALFTTNCLLVAYWERSLDAEQGFSSTPNLVPSKIADRLGHPFAWMAAIGIQLGLLSLTASVLPRLYTAAILISLLATGLAGITIHRSSRPSSLLAAQDLVRINPKIGLVDATLWVPAGILLCVM